MDAQLQSVLKINLKAAKLFFFMKGTPEMPQCGFSAKTAAILKSYGLPFSSFNIFDDEDIRQGLKEYSEWPTYPQLYVNGQLVGGCDIVTEMHENGELKAVLEAAK